MSKQNDDKGGVPLRIEEPDNREIPVAVPADPADVSAPNAEQKSGQKAATQKKES